MMNFFLLDTGVKTIYYTTTLFYYDSPQIFEACDATGGYYIALLIERQDGRERYLVVGVALEKLCRFRSGMLDLRSLLIETGNDGWYVTATETNLDQPIVLDPQDIPIETSQFLPDEGFVLRDHPTDEFTLEETRERDGLSSELFIPSRS